MTATNHLRYRPEVDGLRAIAVLAVVLFHVGLGCPGGFVGVDIFFVISGFLITSLIWKDLQAGKFTFSNFWERRFRRIAPALLVMAFTTVVASCFIMLPEDLEHVGESAGAMLLLAANVYFWKNADYFAPSAETMPLLHTWSLAVEEQFYLVMPFLLLLMYRRPKLANKKAVIVVLSGLLVLSFITACRWMDYRVASGFYLLPSRAWELLMGALIGFLPVPAGILKARFSRELLSFTGLGLILYSIFAYTGSTEFPGVNAIPPCLGTAMIIWSHGGANTQLTWVGRVLACRPMVFVGLISYSLYLWHWPVLVFALYNTTGSLSLVHQLVVLSTGVTLGVLSWRYVETPFRTRQLGTTYRDLMKYVWSGTGVVMAISLTYIGLQGIPQRMPENVARIAAASDDRLDWKKTSFSHLESGTLRNLGLDDPSKPVSVLVWGDSHAASAIPALDEAFKELGIRGQIANRAGVPSVLNWQNTKSSKQGMIAYNQAVFDYAIKHNIRDVLLISRWPAYTIPHVDRKKDFIPSLVKTVKTLKAAGCQPHVMISVPEHPFDVPRALALEERNQTQGHVDSLSSRPGGQDEFNAEVVQQIQEAGGIVINPRPLFLDPENGHYIVRAKNGTVLYYDDDHLTVDGAKLMLTSFLQEHISKAVSPTSSMIAAPEQKSTVPQTAILPDSNKVIR